MLRSRLHQIEIVTIRQEPAISLAHRFGQRLLAAPGLDHNLLRQISVENLVPAHHHFSMLPDDLLQTSVEICLQIQVVLEMMAAFECPDCRIAVPLLAVDLVAADVEVLIGEQP